MALVSKNFLVNYHKGLAKLNQHELSERSQKSELLGVGSVISRMLSQTKTISQIITYIWLYADSEKLARQARDWFQNPTKLFDQDGEPQDPGEALPSLAELMGASYDDEGKYGELLRLAVPDVKDDQFYKFPIFNKYDIETGLVIFQTNVNIFNGSIKDPDANAPNLLTVEIAFPPCPKFGESTLTEDELQKWWENRDSNVYMANNPYIPTCSS